MDSTSSASGSNLIEAAACALDSSDNSGAVGSTRNSNLTFHQFSDTILSTVVYFHVLRMKDSFFLWVGSSKPELRHLAISTTAAASSTILLGDMSDLNSQNLAARLAKRTKKQVLVSYNIRVEFGQGNFMALVEKRLCEEMQKHPDKF